MAALLAEVGGAERDRTADPLLAKQVLSQLSYSPMINGDRFTFLALPPPSAPSRENKSVPINHGGSGKI